MSSPPETHEDPLNSAAGQAGARMMALLSAAAECAVLLQAIHERRRANQAITQAQEERAQAATERIRRDTDRVQWHRAMDDDWLDAARVDELATAWIAGRTWMHRDPEAAEAVERIQETMFVREPEAMDLYQRLIGAPYPPEEAMRQAAEWFTRRQDNEQKARAERTATGVLEPAEPTQGGPDVVTVEEREDLREAITRALPDLAQEIIQDEAWPTLAHGMARVVQGGEDPAAVVSMVAAERELTTASSYAQVLSWRVERHLKNAPPPSPGDSPESADAGPLTDADRVRAMRAMGKTADADGTEYGADYYERQWRVAHAYEEESPGAARAARWYERQLIESDPQARALYERQAPPVNADTIASSSADQSVENRQQQRDAQRVAFADYAQRTGLTTEAETPATPPASSTPPEPRSAPLEEWTPDPEKPETQRYMEELEKLGVVGPGESTRAREVLVKPDTPQFEAFLAGASVAPPEPAAASSAVTSEPSAEVSSSTTAQPPVEPTVTSDAGSPAARNPRPQQPHAAPVPQPSTPGPVAGNILDQAANAARLARMASPKPVDQALPQQAREGQAVSGKVVLGREANKGKKPSRRAPS